MVNIKGEKLTLPFTKEYADSMTLVMDTGDLWTDNGKASTDNQGNPPITTYERKHEGLVHFGSAEIKC